jgi:probable F420-dependent oxidoreductase
MTLDRQDLQGIGIASSTPFVSDVGAVTDEARHVEQLGFTMLWRSGVLPMVEAAVEATERIPIGTGIIQVSTVPADDVLTTYRRLRRDHPGRFVVGLGGAHDDHPFRTLGAYLDALDAEDLPASDRVLAALGPKMQQVAHDRARGAYSYLVTPDYVIDARARLGDDHLVAVLLMTIASTDLHVVRRAASEPLAFLTGVGGYRSNLLRLGFTEDDIDGVSDRLLDGIAAWGDPEAIGERIAEYRAAGADQVVLRILDLDGDMAATRERLARTLLR